MLNLNDYNFGQNKGRKNITIEIQMIKFNAMYLFK